MTIAEPSPAPEPSRLILASTSIYRRELLARLHLPFDVCAPEVDEAALPDERPMDTAKRLALAKARAVASRSQDAIVIGSDQVADLDGHALGKPGTREGAVEQLRRMSGHMVVFHTAVAVLCLRTGFCATDIASVSVRFRDLDASAIDDYLALEQPFDCAGSAKAEGLGISLLEAIESDDPTALIGLPLIRTGRMLRAAGLAVPPRRSTNT